MINKPIPEDPERSPSPPPPPFAQIDSQSQCLPRYPLQPSRSLITMSMVSCFLAIAAFVSSLTGYDSIHPVVMPNTLGFLFTVPFHVHLYLSALTRTPFLGTHDIVYMFFLVSLWIWIFFMNACSASSHRVGVILGTVASGMAWPTILFMALKSTSEVRRIDNAGPETDLSESEGSSGSDETSAGAGGYPISRPIRHHPPARTTEPRSLIFFASFVFCTITAMIFHYRCTFLAPLNVAAYLATAPHHIALFVSGRREGGGGGLARKTPLPYACFLVSLWCCVFVLDVSHAARTKLFQKIVAGIFGGVECMVVVALAVRSVSDSLEEGQIKLV